MLLKKIVLIVCFYCLGEDALLAVQANTVIATINVGVTPAGLAVTPDGLFAYVANNNNYGIAGADNVSVLDLTNNLLLTTINDASFSEPYTVSINPAGTFAYVTNSFGTTVTVIDIATNTVMDVIPGFNGPSGMAITSDGSTGYVNNYGADGSSGEGNTVSVVDLTTNTIIDTIVLGPVGTAPAAITISPDNKYVFTINYETGNPGTGTMSVIDTATNTVVNGVAGFSGPFAIALTPNGRLAYVTNFGSNNFEPFGTTVSVVDLLTNMIIDTIELDIQPSGIAITPDGKYAYATNYNTLYAGTDFSDLTAGQGTVNIIDLATNTVIPPIIAVNQSPSAVAISPNGAYAYVSNYTSGTVNVIALQTFTIAARGMRTQSRFSSQIDFINKITWGVSGTLLPVNYAIYKDAGLTDLAGVVSAAASSEFLVHNTNPSISSIYYLVGTNSLGISSEPVSVTIS